MQISSKSPYSVPSLVFYTGAAVLASITVYKLIRWAITYFQKPLPKPTTLDLTKKPIPPPAREIPPLKPPAVEDIKVAPPRIIPDHEILRGKLESGVHLRDCLDAPEIIQRYRDDSGILTQIARSFFHKRRSIVRNREDLADFLSHLQDTHIAQVMTKICSHQICSSTEVRQIFEVFQGVKQLDPGQLLIDEKSSGTGDLTVSLEHLFSLLSFSFSDSKATQIIRHELMHHWWRRQATAAMDIERSNRILLPIFEYLAQNLPSEVIAQALIALSYTYHPYINGLGGDFRSQVHIFVKNELPQFNYLMEICATKTELKASLRGALRQIYLSNQNTTKCISIAWTSGLFLAAYFQVWENQKEMKDLLDLLWNFVDHFYVTYQGFPLKTESNRNLPLAFTLSVLQEVDPENPLLALAKKQLAGFPSLWETVAQANS